MDTMYDSEWGEYDDGEVEKVTDGENVEETEDDFDYSSLEIDDDFDFTKFDLDEEEDEYSEARKDPVLSEWIPIPAKITPSNVDEQQMWGLAKAWYSGSHNTPDNIVPGKSAGNTITAGKYASMALKKFRETGDWKIALGAPEGSGNNLDTKTGARKANGERGSSAVGRLQIIKGTREGAYRKLGISRSDFPKAEQMYKTDANFQSQVEDAVKDDMMSRMTTQQYGGTMTPRPVTIPAPNLNTNVYNQSPTDYLKNDFSSGVIDLHKGEKREQMFNQIGSGINDVIDTIGENQKDFGTLASGLIDTASDQLANVQNNYNLRKFNQMKNQKKYIFNPVTQNDVPIYT